MGVSSTSLISPEQVVQVHLLPLYSSYSPFSLNLQTRFSQILFLYPIRSIKTSRYHNNNNSIYNITTKILNWQENNWKINKSWLLEIPTDDQIRIFQNIEIDPMWDTEYSKMNWEDLEPKFMKLRDWWYFYSKFQMSWRFRERSWFWGLRRFYDFVWFFDGFRYMQVFMVDFSLLAWYLWSWFHLAWLILIKIFC